MSQILVPFTTASGGLYTATGDTSAKYAPGIVIEDVGSDGYLRKFQYGYNGLATSAHMVKGTPYHQSWGAAGVNPSYIVIVDNTANIALVGVAMSAIEDTCWGWFQIEGPSIIRVVGASLSPTDGQEAYFNNGAIAARTLSLLDTKGFGTFIEARTTQTTYYIWLFGRLATNTS